jgi:hypothetical protein
MYNNVAKTVLGVKKQADKPCITEETWKKIDERKEIRNKIISETRVVDLSRLKQGYKDKDIQDKEEPEAIDEGSARSSSRNQRKQHVTTI